MARKRIVRVKLGGNWLSKVKEDYHLFFSMDKSKALALHLKGDGLIHILMQNHGIENYKIIESYE